MQISDKHFRFIIKPIVFLLLLVPFIYYATAFWQNMLGANPLEAVIRGSGDWALRILLIILAVSPLRRLTGWAKLLRLRRMLGLYAYFYAVLHLLGYLWFDQFFDWSEIWFDILQRPFITIGMLTILVLTPLAITSTKGMIRRLGKNWKRLHTLVYPATIFAVIHFFWMVKLDITEPTIYAFILAILLSERLLRWKLKNLKKN